MFQSRNRETFDSNRAMLHRRGSTAGCFNLVIEKLLIPTEYQTELQRVGFIGFNLVIEKLMIPTTENRIYGTCHQEFQSRNREAYDSNMMKLTGTIRLTGLLQSRNREAYDSNFHLLQTLCECHRGDVSIS